MPLQRTVVRSQLRLVYASTLDCVELDEDQQVEGAKTLLEFLDPPIGDSAPRSLRWAIQLSYEPSLDKSSEEYVRESGRKVLLAAGELGAELELLRLRRVDVDSSYERDDGAKVFMFCIVRSSELGRRVTVQETGRGVCGGR